MGFSTSLYMFTLWCPLKNCDNHIHTALVYWRAPEWCGVPIKIVVCSIQTLTVALSQNICPEYTKIVHENHVFLWLPWVSGCTNKWNSKRLSSAHSDHALREQGVSLARVLRVANACEVHVRESASCGGGAVKPKIQTRSQHDSGQHCTPQPARAGPHQFMRCRLLTVHATMKRI